MRFKIAKLKEIIQKTPKLYLKLFVAFFILGTLVGKFISTSSHYDLEDIEHQLKEETTSKPVPVAVSSVEIRNIQKNFVTYSNLRPWKEVIISPETNSTVKELNVGLGEIVEKGQEIAVLGSEVSKLKKELKKIESDLQEKEFRSLMVLAKKNFISEYEIYSKKMEVRANKLREQISKLESNTDRLVSPIDGIVSELNIKEGDFIDGHSKSYIKISDTSGYKIELYLPRMIAQQISVDEVVKVIKQENNGDGQVIKDMADAVVTAISPQIDPKTGTVFTEIAIEGENMPIWPIGSYIKVLITTDSSNETLAIRNESIIYEKQKPVIYRVIASEEGSKVHKINPELGLSDGKFTEILGGVENGDEIVIEGQGGLQDSTRVESVSF